MNKQVSTKHDSIFKILNIENTQKNKYVHQTHTPVSYTHLDVYKRQDYLAMAY